MSDITEVGDILKRNLPEYLQGRENLDSYLEAAAVILGEAKEKIRGFSRHKDYDQAEAYMVDLNLSELGFDLPQKIHLPVKRQILRDVMEIHKRRGTEDGIRQSLRILGLDSEIRQGWALNAEGMRRGLVTDLVDYTERTFEGNETIYMDLLYGDVVDEEDGTKFIGHQYWDVGKEYPTDKLSIVGETYTGGFVSPHTVEATPYVVVEFDNDGIFLVDDEESTDPETGEKFPYTVSERFELLEDVIRYFIKGKYRPTTVRVIVVSMAMAETDTITYSEKIRVTINEGWSDLTDLEDSFSVEESFFSDQATTLGDTRIGIDPNLTTDGGIGDLYHLADMNSDSEAGDVVGVFYCPDSETVIYLTEVSTYIPLHGTSSVNYTNNGGSDCGVEYMLQGNVESTEQVADGASLNFDNDFTYDAIVLTFSGQPIEHILEITGGEIQWNTL